MSLELEDLLENVPVDLTSVIKLDPKRTRIIYTGNYCKDAAVKIRELKLEIEELKRVIFYKDQKLHGTQK